MIKRIRFARRGTEVAPADFADRWHEVMSRSAAAPLAVRPLRITAATALTGDEWGPPPVHDGLGLEWFVDADHLARFESWSRSPETDAAGELGSTPVVSSTTTIAAEEVVLRGADWLDRRWAAGSPAFKHVAIATRAAGLTPAEFSQRWRSGSGRVSRSGAQPAVVIPDDARGLAYVQNHPVPRPQRDWAYDAVNEVTFEDLDQVRTRVAFFRDQVGADAERDLISANWFLVLHEQVVLTAP